MRHRIDLGAGLVALGAIGLLVSLFLDWYSPALSAWDAFEIVDWALVLCAVAALVAVAIALRERHHAAAVADARRRGRGRAHRLAGHRPAAARARPGPRGRRVDRARAAR